MERQGIPQNLLEAVGEVQTLENSVAVYDEAQISLRYFYADEVYPTALYVLRPHLQAVACIGQELAQAGINIFDLDEVIEYNGILIAPPIVELSDGVPAIVDGIHRFYLAKQLGLPVKAIYVEGAKLPLISYPVTWEQVQEYDEAPQNPRHRRALRLGIEDTSESLRQYYRDFSLFGSRGRRPRHGQNG